MLGRVTVDELDLLRARPDETHISLENVQELRKLVEARSTEEAAEPRYSRIIAELEDRFRQTIERHKVGK